MNYSDSESSKASTRGVIFTDFDGTLFNHNGAVTRSNLEALKTARESGYVTSIATGRSLFSFNRVLKQLDMPITDYIDYLIFSSGAGVLRYPEAKLIETEELPFNEALEAAGLLFRHGIDFMIQQKVPENHRFIYIKSNGSVNPDFYRRIKIYSDYSSGLEPGDGDSDLDRIEKICLDGVSQLVAIVPPSGGDDEKHSSDLLEYLRHRLSGCTIIRTTSPIDHKSLWIEVFNKQVSKSKAAARLAAALGVKASDCLAVGNDFNDEDLLSWGRHLTLPWDEAPEALKRLHQSAGSSN